MIFSFIREKNKKSAEQAAALVAAISLELISPNQLQTAVKEACSAASNCVEFSEKNKIETSSEFKYTETTASLSSVNITNLDSINEASVSWWFVLINKCNIINLLTLKEIL